MSSRLPVSVEIKIRLFPMTVTIPGCRPKSSVNGSASSTLKTLPLHLVSAPGVGFIARIRASTAIELVLKSN
jgi:hypothetical protein